MKKILPLLLMVMCAVCSKAQVTSPNQVIKVSVIDPGKPANEPTTAPKKRNAAPTNHVNAGTGTAKPADGAVTTDKLADDLIKSLYEADILQGKKSSPAQRKKQKKMESMTFGPTTSPRSVISIK